MAKKTGGKWVTFHDKAGKPKKVWLRNVRRGKSGKYRKFLYHKRKTAVAARATLAAQGYDVNGPVKKYARAKAGRKYRVFFRWHPKPKGMKKRIGAKRAGARAAKMPRMKKASYKLGYRALIKVPAGEWRSKEQATFKAALALRKKLQAKGWPAKVVGKTVQYATKTKLAKAMKA